MRVRGEKERGERERERVMEGHCEDDPMEEEVVEAMPRRIKGRGGLRAPSKTLDLDHPNNPPFPRCNASQSPSYAPQRCQFLSLWRLFISFCVMHFLCVRVLDDLFGCSESDQ